MGIEKKDTKQNSVKDVRMPEYENIIKKIEMIEFDELASYVNGIRILAPTKIENVTSELGRELWKMRIADPVSYAIIQGSTFNSS